MTSYKVPQGTLDAARTIVANGTGRYVHQVHEIVIRDIDPNEAEPRVLRLVPLGDVLGVAITKDGEQPADADLLFVSMHALGNVLPALGFTIAARPVTAGYIVHPKSADNDGAGTDQE